MNQLEAIIPAYIKNNIPFALFRYPKKATTLIAQYAFSPFIKSINHLNKGFLIHPFKVNENCPIACIQPDIYTTDFAQIDLKKIPNLSAKASKVFNETCIDRTNYLSHLNKYKETFQKSNLQKAIYSRIKAFNTIPMANLVATFLKMEALYSNAFCYLFQLPGYGIWMGASPERLLSYQNNIGNTVALAGTKNVADQNKNWGDKEKEEQSFVSKFIKDLLKQFDLKLLNEGNTETIQAGSLQHLKTAFEFSLPDKKVIQFLNALHPTPAVAGYPQKEAIDMILNTEIHNRQYYTGYLGFINSNEADLYVNLRCAKITNQHSLAFVGGGITKDSDSALEWEETENKSKTMGRLIISN